MKYLLTLSRGESAANGQIFAQTTDPVLVRQTLTGLVNNRLMEDDGHDRVPDPAFVAFARGIIADLTEEIRRTACRLPPDADEDTHDGQQARRELG